jgi:hypothetical protein
MSNAAQEGVKVTSSVFTFWHDPDILAKSHGFHQDIRVLPRAFSNDTDQTPMRNGWNKVI